MKAFKFSSLVLISILSSSALAQPTGKTRADVKAETRAAIRSGDIAAPGDSGKTLREQSPERYEPRKTSRRAKAARPSVSPAQPAPPQ